MLKTFTFIFLITGHVQSYVVEESTEPDSLGDCAAMFPKNHVIRRACYSAHAVCRRYNLNPDFVNELKSNMKVYNDIEMRLPSGASIPYSIYEADPSLFDEIYEKILVLSNPPVSLPEYREIITDSDFRIARALHRTSDQNLLSEMIEISLDYLDEDDVTVIVGNWFQGDFKIIVPLINDYLPELENITIVQVADNYPKLSEVKKVMKNHNIILEKVNPRDLSPIILNNGQKMSVEEIRQILDYFKKPNNATVLPGVEYESFRMMHSIQSDVALPIWQWMKVYDEIHTKEYQHSRRFPVIRLMPRNHTTAHTDSATEIISATTVQSVGKSEISTGFSSLPHVITYSSDRLEKIDCISSPVRSENLNIVDTDEDAIFSSVSENQKNEYVKGKDSEYSDLPKHGKSFESDDEDRPISEENVSGPKSSNPRKSGLWMKSAVEDTNSIYEQPHHATVNRFLQPQIENSLRNSTDHYSTLASFFSSKENKTKFQDKIFTTCALYYLKVNGTQDRAILSEAGILSFPMKRFCDELLRLESYNGNIQHLEQEQNLKSSENSTLLERVENPSQNSPDESSTAVNRKSFLRTVKPSKADMEAFEVLNRQVQSARGRFGAKNEEDKPYARVHFNRPSERSASERSQKNSIDFPISSFDEKHNFNRFSRKNGIRQHKPVRRGHRFNLPERRPESFFDDVDAIPNNIHPVSHRSRRLRRTPKNYYRVYEPEMNPYDLSKIEKESDVDYADEDKFSPNKILNGKSRFLDIPI